MTVAGITFEVVDVPGHSAGHVAFHADGELFSGDLLFAGSVGRVDLPGGDWETLLGSVRALLDRFPPETVVRPGHGPATTLGRELRDEPVPRASCAPRRSHVTEQFQAPRGTHDVLPEGRSVVARGRDDGAGDGALRRGAASRRPASRTPGSSRAPRAQASDVVHKEMYTLHRPQRPLADAPPGRHRADRRAYIEHGLHREPQPVKAYTIAPMYRYGAPGRGRYREHYQLSVEAIGSADPAIDAEIIQLYHELLRRLGVTQWELHLNSIGDANCRPAYVERLNAWLDEHADVLDEDARHKRATSPLQVFDVKTPAVRAALERAPKIGESLCDDVPGALRRSPALNSTLYGVPYVLDPTLVRGLDYYSRTTFEFIGPDENANSTICGGGRYDGLIEQIGGPATPGDRLRRRPRAAAARAGEREHHVRGGAGDRRVLRRRRRRRTRPRARRARSSCAAPGLAADTDYAGRSLKGQLTQAGRSGAHTVVVVRDDGARDAARTGTDEQVGGLDEVVATLTA